MEVSITTPTVHTKDWLKTLEGVEEYLRTSCGVNGTPLSYFVRKQLVPTAEAENPLNGCDTIDEEIIARAAIMVAGTAGNTASLEENGPFITSYLTDWATVWGKSTATFSDSTTWKYCKVGKRQLNVRKGYLALYDHYLGPNNFDHMTSAAEKIL